MNTQRGPDIRQRKINSEFLSDLLKHVMVSPKDHSSKAAGSFMNKSLLKYLGFRDRYTKDMSN